MTTPTTDRLLLPLPDRSEALRDATWGTLAPLYDALLAAEPAAGDDPSAWTEAWTATWSTLDALVREAGAFAYWDYSRDTTNAEAEARYLRWASEIGPELDAARTRLASRALGLGLTRPDLVETLENWRTDVRLFREANKPRLARLEELSAEYDKQVGALTVEWEGQTVPATRVMEHLHSPHRPTREAAFSKNLRAYWHARPDLTGIYGQMVPLRDAVAREAGHDDFVAYKYDELYRRDYGPDDARRWADAVEAAVVPAVERLRAFRRERLGLDALRPWDLNAPLFGGEPLHPYSTVEDLIAGGERVLGAVDPRMADVIPEMRREALLDLENRGGKAPGGYCTTFDVRGLSGIFMNAVGVADDVMTLLHEAGHALHHRLAASRPLVWTRSTGMEAAELASMTMELLAAPHLVRPTGFYEPEDAARAEYEHLEDVLSFFPHCATVELFQQWVYRAPDGADAAAQDRSWLALRERFDRGVSWQGLEAERTARWYKQGHIFQVPFYYIEYGLAQLGALQLWRIAQRDRAAAVTGYLNALTLGGTASLRDIYAAAGVTLVFDEATMRELVQAVEERLGELRAVLDA
jgi:oligoendopeptidase F